MTMLLIEPHDPLIFRDGRPFNPTPGVRATSHRFPLPSTTAGAVRTMLGTDAQGKFDLEQVKDLLAMRMRGPLLGELANEKVTWMVPAPADALLLESDAQAAICKQLLPLQAPEGFTSDIGAAEPHLHLIGPRRFSPAKGLSGAPRFWYWSQFEQWLSRSGALDHSRDPDTKDTKIISLAELGHDGPESEQRMSVGIDPTTQTAEESMLFQTRGLSFGLRHTQLRKGKVEVTRPRLVLALDVNLKKWTLSEQVAPLGGERRLARWDVDPKGATLPTLPEGLIKAIVAARACRVILLTPAWWERGYYPTWLCQERDGVKPELVAVANGRPQIHSGWDYARRQAKPARRLASAGTVVFLRLNGSESALNKWVKQRWFHSASDEASPADQHKGIALSQWQLDGFGVAAIGAWDGKLVKMSMEHV